MEFNLHWMVGSHRNPIIVIHKLTRKAINLHNEITTKYLIAFQSTIQQFQTRELIMERELKRRTSN